MSNLYLHLSCYWLKHSRIDCVRWVPVWAFINLSAAVRLLISVKRQGNKRRELNNTYRTGIIKMRFVSLIQQYWNISLIARTIESTLTHSKYFISFWCVIQKFEEKDVLHCWSYCYYDLSPVIMSAKVLNCVSKLEWQNVYPHKHINNNFQIITQSQPTRSRKTTRIPIGWTQPNKGPVTDFERNFQESVLLSPSVNTTVNFRLIFLGF